MGHNEPADVDYNLGGVEHHTVAVTCRGNRTAMRAEPNRFGIRGTAAAGHDLLTRNKDSVMLPGE
jgi:hypothetical protein